jgi:hypothetical protein
MERLRKEEEERRTLNSGGHTLLRRRDSLRVTRFLSIFRIAAPKNSAVSARTEFIIRINENCRE